MCVPQLPRTPKGGGGCRASLSLNPTLDARDAVAKPRILAQMSIWRWMGRRRLQGAVSTVSFLLEELGNRAYNSQRNRENEPSSHNFPSNDDAAAALSLLHSGVGAVTGQVALT